MKENIFNKSRTLGIVTEYDGFNGIIKSHDMDFILSSENTLETAPLDVGDEVLFKPEIVNQMGENFPIARYIQLSQKYEQGVERTKKNVPFIK